MEKLFKWLFKPRYVYVVCAIENEIIKECIVLDSIPEALTLRNKLDVAYGAANVCMVSREINQVPVSWRFYEPE